MAFWKQSSKGRVILKLLGGAVVYYTVAIVLLSVQLSESQSQEENATANATNDTAIHPSCISLEKTECSRLPAVCVSCNFFNNETGLPECIYNQNTTFSCWALEEAECQGNRNFSVTFPCRYCYQTGEDEQCCSPDDTCNVRGTPPPRYQSECEVNENVFCLPPRMFERLRPCNYSEGKRWTTAFLLSMTLGGFGVDRFYLEQWGAAVGKLLSFGGLGVWSILDVILIGTGYVGPADGSAYIY